MTDYDAINHDDLWHTVCIVTVKVSIVEGDKESLLVATLLKMI